MRKRKPEWLRDRRCGQSLDSRGRRRTKLANGLTETTMSSSLPPEIFDFDFIVDHLLDEPPKIFVVPPSEREPELEAGFQPRLRSTRSIASSPSRRFRGSGDIFSTELSSVRLDPTSNPVWKHSRIPPTPRLPTHVVSSFPVSKLSLSRFGWAPLDQRRRFGSVRE